MTMIEFNIQHAPLNYTSFIIIYPPVRVMYNLLLTLIQTDENSVLSAVVCEFVNNSHSYLVPNTKSSLKKTLRIKIP